MSHLKDEQDEFYDDAVKFVAELGNITIAKIQRKFIIGYNRAQSIIESLVENGIIIPVDSANVE